MTLDLNVYKVRKSEFRKISHMRGITSTATIYITKIVVLVSEPVRGRSRVTEVPCLSLFDNILVYI